MPNRTRNYGIKIYFNDEELSLLDAKMKKSGINSRSKYIRELVKYNAIYNIDYSYIRSYSYELSKIGTNINQIAHMANSSGNINENEIRKLQEEMNKIWQLQRSMQLQEPLINP